LAVDRLRVERLAQAHLTEYFRLLGLQTRLSVAPSAQNAAPPATSTTERLLIGLLEDKIRQSLERVFRLLKIAHPDQSIHRVHVALTSKDLRAHANAAEFLDTLLSRPDQRALRRLLQILEDDLSPEQRVLRATPLLSNAPPRGRAEALDRLTLDADATVSALAVACLAESAGEPMDLEIGGHALSVLRGAAEPSLARTSGSASA
jgi:AAA family ATP:ADP antiporter